jgi:hypothetical protein
VEHDDRHRGRLHRVRVHRVPRRLRHGGRDLGPHLYGLVRRHPRQRTVVERDAPQRRARGDLRRSPAVRLRRRRVLQPGDRGAAVGRRRSRRRPRSPRCRGDRNHPRPCRTRPGAWSPSR